MITTICRALLLPTLLVAVAAPMLEAGTIRHDANPQAYVDLGASAAYASVGRIETRTSSFGSIASGTLISDRWVLTAAHVIQNATGLSFNVGGQTYTADAWVTHSAWNGNLSAGYDIGLMHLSAPVTGVAAATRYTGSAEVGATATIVGYGMTGTGATGATSYDGKKRAGQNVIDSLGNARVLTFDFDSGSAADSRTGSATPLALEYMIASGDSGGGAFMQHLGMDVLIGVHSSTWATDGKLDSDYGDTANAIRVSAFNSWIDAVMGSSFSTLASGAFGTYGGFATDLPDDGIANAVAAPEPGTLALMTLAMTAMLRRRR